MAHKISLSGLKLKGKRIYDVLLAPNDALTFLSADSRDLLQGGALQDAVGAPATPETITKLNAIWRSLVIDAIHFLRINDGRERAFVVDRAKPWTDENKTTMSTDGAEASASLNTYGIEELQSYFKEFTNFESALYGTDSYYRDHIQHPLRVWLIGLNILYEFADVFRFCVANRIKCIRASCADPKWPQFKDLRNAEDPQIANPEDLEPAEQVHDPHDLPISTAELTAMWTVAALTHDLGYPLEKVERINDQLERMLHQFGKIGFRRSDFSFQSQHDHLVEHLLRIISSSLETNAVARKPWRTHLRPKYYAKFSKSWENFDHGIVSSLILLRSLTFFLETDLSVDDISNLSNEDARQFAVRSEILHTIASHTTPRVYHLAANTLPFILVLCDELQEWGRPTMADLREGVLSGGAKQVTIMHCQMTETESNIQCKVEYGGPENIIEQKRHAIRVFKGWHERLRPAADDRRRHMQFLWEITFGNTPIPWRFEIDNQKPVFQQVDVRGPDKDDPNKARSYSLYE